MRARAVLCIAAREMQRLDWPRVFLALVASFAIGRVLAGAQPDAVAGAACAIGFAVSQFSFTRESRVALTYFAAPVPAGDLCGALACVPVGVCTLITGAFAAGAHVRAADAAALWLTLTQASAGCALIMQSARMRRGSSAFALRALALLFATAVAAAQSAGDWWFGLAIALCATLFALRSFREALRRYDPALAGG